MSVILMVFFILLQERRPKFKKREILEVNNAERSYQHLSHIINLQKLIVYFVARSEQRAYLKNLPSIFGYGVC